MENARSGDLLNLDEANRRVNFVYRHLLDEFDPAVKKLVEAGATLFKALLSVTNAQKAYAEALGKVGETAKPCHSDTKRIGFAIHELTEIFSKIQEQQDHLIAWFGSQFIHPTETNVKEDSTTLNELWKLYHKGQKNIGKEMKRGSKNGMATEGLEKQMVILRNEGLRQALNEEKKRYVFVLDRHCAWMDEYMTLQKLSIDLLTQKVEEWKDVCHGSLASEEEPAAALAILDFAIDQEEIIGTSRRNTNGTISDNHSENGPIQSSIHETSNSRGTSISLSDTGDQRERNPPPESVMPAPQTVFYAAQSHREEGEIIEVVSEVVRTDNQQWVNNNSQQWVTTESQPGAQYQYTPPVLKEESEGRVSSLSQTSSASTTSSIKNKGGRRSDSDSSENRLPVSTLLTVETATKTRMVSSPPPPSVTEEVPPEMSPAPPLFVRPPTPPPLPSPTRKTALYSTPIIYRNEEKKQNSAVGEDFKSVRETTAVYKAPQPASAAPKASALKTSSSSGKAASVQFSETLTIRSPSGSIGDTEPATAIGSTVDALYDYSALLNNQLTMQYGDEIRVIQEGKQGWVFGQNLNSQKRGWFPRSYVKIKNTQSPVAVPISSPLPLQNGHELAKIEQRPRVKPVEMDRITQISPPRQGDVAIVVKDKSRLHHTNYDTVPRNNPFAHVKLRPVVQENGEPKKYA